MMSEPHVEVLGELTLQTQTQLRGVDSDKAAHVLSCFRRCNRHDAVGHMVFPGLLTIQMNL